MFHVNEAAVEQGVTHQLGVPDHLVPVGIDDGVHGPALGRAQWLPLGREAVVVRIVAGRDLLQGRYRHPQHTSRDQDPVSLLEEADCRFIANMLDAVLDRDVTGAAIRPGQRLGDVHVDIMLFPSSQLVVATAKI